MDTKGASNMFLTLCTNDPSSRSCIRERLAAIFANSEKVQMAVAFVRESGARMLLEMFRQADLQPNQITIVAGKYFDLTEPIALRLLKDVATVRIFTADGAYHPKVYFGSNRNGAINLLIGSANISEPAFTDNVEAMLHFSGTDGVLHDHVDKMFRGFMDRSTIVTDNFIEALREVEWVRNP